MAVYPLSYNKDDNTRQDVSSLPGAAVTGFAGGAVADDKVEGEGAGLFDGFPSRSITLPFFNTGAGANPPDAGGSASDKSHSRYKK